MKFFIGMVFSLVVGIYVMIFTGFGNSLVQPSIEKKIQEYTSKEAHLSRFKLGIDSFSIVLELDSQNIIYLNGNYSLVSQAFDVAYRMRLDNLDSLHKLIQNDDIKGKFYTTGHVKGDVDFMKIKGISDVANSNTSYQIELTNLNPTSIIAKIKKAKLSQLLALGGQKQYADADVDVIVNFKNITPHKLDGDIKLATRRGKLNTKVMKDDFNITIPKTSFGINLDAKLLDDDVDYIFNLKSNLANLNSSGKILPEPLKLDIKYNVNVAELAVLKPITGLDIRGILRLNGIAKGNKDKLIVDAKTNLASSKSKFQAILKDFKPSSIQAKVKNLKIQKLLYMLKQPHYADALLDLNVNITDAREGNLKGKIVSNIKKGLVDAKFITKEYKFKYNMPRTIFRAKTITKLDKNLIDTYVNFNSNLVDVSMKKVRYNLVDSSLKSDFNINIAKLDKLFFVTDRHMLGGIKIGGEIKKAKDLDFIAQTKTVGGKLNINLHNDTLVVDAKNINTLDLLRKLIYPEIFEAVLDAKINYNLATKKGKMSGDLIDGRFTSNSVFDLAKQYTKINMYNELFKGDIKADINQENILASLNLLSKTSSIKTKNTKLNTKTNTINSTINIDANHNLIAVKLSGKTNKPKVKIEADELLKSQVKKAIVKKLGDKLGDKLGGNVSNLLNTFFK